MWFTKKDAAEITAPLGHEVYESVDKSGFHREVDGVNIDWPFLDEAIGYSSEGEAKDIQEALELALAHPSPENVLSLGDHILDRVNSYIEEVKENQ